MLKSAQLAASLIGVKAKPQSLGWLLGCCDEARAYDSLTPYPLYGFRAWKTEDQGPLPRCMPVPKRIARRAGRFLFGRGIEIKCPSNEGLEEFLREAWAANQMPTRMVAAAQRGAVEGNVVLKFAWDPDLKPSLRIQTLSVVDQVRLYYHPHDKQQLLMARIQYRYFEPTGGCWYWFREEWTDAEHVTYVPLKEDALRGMRPSKAGVDPDEAINWVIETRQENPFSTIPLVHIRNIDNDDIYGVGDLWDLYRVVDDLNLAWYQMKRSNQFDSELNPHYIDLELDDEDLEKPLKPGQAVSLQTTQDAKAQGEVIFPQGGNGLRPALMEYARELRKMVEDAAGTVNVDQAEFTNKGNLTQSVLQQLYALLIETTDEKRKTYGQNGIELFLEKIALGLLRIGNKDLAINEKDEESYDVQVGWPEHFPLTEDEKTALVGRIQEEEVAGYTTRERAVQTVAQMEGVRDVPVLMDELKAEAVKKAALVAAGPTATENDPALAKPPAELPGPMDGK